MDNWQTNGVTATGDPGDGDTANGGNCSAQIDSVGCDLNNEAQMTANNYHVHAFLGIWANGKQYAIPDAIGMQNPTDNGNAIGAFTAAYDIHTHDASGIIHVEDPKVAGTFRTIPASSEPRFNLKTLLDIWGVSLSSSGFAKFSGQTSIYMGTVSGTNPATGDDLVTSYTLNNSAPQSILLAHHVAIWIIIGPPPATLPEIDFGIED